MLKFFGRGSFESASKLAFFAGFAGLALLGPLSSLSVDRLFTTKPMGRASMPRFLTLAFPFVGRMEPATVMAFTLGFEIAPMKIAAKG